MDDYIKKIDNFNNSLKYIDIIEDNMFCDNNSIVINYPEIITSYNEFYLLNDTEDEPMATMPLKEFSTEDMDELDDDFKFLDFLLNEENQEPITLNEIYAEFIMDYNRPLTTGNWVVGVRTSGKRGSQFDRYHQQL